MPNFRGVVNSVIKLDRTWQYQGKTMYVFEVSVGQHRGEYSSQSENQNKFVTGQEVEYTYEPNSNEKYIGKIKPVHQQGGGNAYQGGKSAYKPYQKDDSEEKLASMAYSYAKDMVVAGKIDASKLNEAGEKIAFGIQNLAAKLKAAKPKDEPQLTSEPRAQYNPPTQAPAPTTPPPVEGDFNDDVPF